MSAVSEGKVTLRKQLRKKLQSLEAEEVHRSSALICAQIEALPEFQRARTIFAFIGTGWEIDTTVLLTHALAEGKRVAIPVVTGPGIMECRLISNLRELIPGAYGIPEPYKDAPICPPSQIDFAVIPCVSCDKTCMRLGQGGGFYDRFMTHGDFFSAAVCRDMGLLDCVPAESWDQPVDCVVTETAIYRR